jgi:hypothetical protein
VVVGSGGFWHGSLAGHRESIVPMPWMEKAAFLTVAIAIRWSPSLPPSGNIVRAGILVRIIAKAPPERRQLRNQ